jgi:glutamine amidotransferase
MSVSVGIVDYQMGNLRSVAKAIENVGGKSIVSSNPSELEMATHLILPGVGAFGDAMHELTKRDLIPWIRDWVHQNRPFLGICLGMQLLFDSSEEGGSHAGLSIIPGKVIRFRNEGLAAEAHRKIPHMGWNQVTSTISPDPMLAGVPSQPFVYFVHSYYCVPDDPSVTWLTCDYGQTFCAAVRRGNLLATQFHPEKSQADGLRLLGNFLQLPVEGN